MCGELYFPSAADCETQPTPTRVTKIPIEFNSLIEYKSVFRAALRGMLFLSGLFIELYFTVLLAKMAYDRDLA